MNENGQTVLVVDDDEINRELIFEYLRETEIMAVGVGNGESAMNMLQQAPDKFSAVLLDRMLPGLDGIEVLRGIKTDPELSMLPVIMQTAKDEKKDILDGLRAGAYYYLTKPYDRQTLLAIARTALNDYKSYLQLQTNVRQTSHTLKMMTKGRFIFQTLDEARGLAALLANACNDSNHVVLGLTELMVNAIEHGNLGIGYEEKSRLSALGEWESEIKHRLSQPEHAGKQVTVEFERRENSIMFAILDQGDGFEWQKYLELSPDRALDSHGRGIAMANSISFDKIEYRGNGNEVCVTVVNRE
jgi:DNA-binding response OmpR family regulator